MKYLLLFSILIYLVACSPYRRQRHLLEDDPMRVVDTMPRYEFVDGVLREVNEEPQRDEGVREQTGDKKPTILANVPSKSSRSYSTFRRNDHRINTTIKIDSKTFELESSSKILTKSRGPSRIEEAPQRDSSFVFPDEYERNAFNPVVTGSCTKTFCTESSYYPEKHVETVIKTRIAEFGDLLGADEISPVNITQRIDANDEFPLCPSREELIRPTSAKNKNDEWFFIANSGDIEQTVRVEMCLSDPQTCALSNSFPTGYVGHCKQKYILRKLVALDKKGGTPMTDSFKLPSCCSCYYTKTTDTLTKFGVKQTPLRPPRNSKWRGL